jgi:glycosyltransferase involved in cell wall biosynthesis
MKICFISNLYAPFIIGGAEICVQREAEALRRKGHDILVVTTSSNGKEYTEKFNDIRVIRLNFTNIYSPYSSKSRSNFSKPFYHLINLWSPYTYFVIKKILSKEMPDVVHVHNYRGLSLSVFGAVKSLNLPLIFTAHDYSLICLRSTMLNRWGSVCENQAKVCTFYKHVQKLLINNKPDIVTAPSQFMLNKLSYNGFFKNVKLEKLSLGVELSDLKPVKNYDVLDVLYVGALSKHKGVHILLEAFKQIEFRNIRLHIVGKGIDEEELINIAGSDPRITFHGFVSTIELTKLYENANISVVPSIWYDNSPTVIYESLMNGTPVVGSRIGGIPELIEEGVNGFLFKPGDVEELYNIFLILINDPNKLSLLVSGAFESIKKYSIEAHINKLEELYSDVYE